MASAPSANNPAPGYSDHPDYRVDLVPCAKRIRATFAGKTVFDTRRSVIMCESRHIALYYVPRDDADMSMMTKTDHSTFCPFKGSASYYTFTTDGHEAENAIWSYEAPFDEAMSIKGWLAFYWNKLDQWFEEDEEVFIHARDPFVRCDILESGRKVEVMAGGETIASTNRARFLFETGHQPRYYIPREDVTVEVLMPSELRTGCPYKGTAHYHHIKAGGTTIDDAAWYYPAPLDEVRRIGDYLCFYPEKVDAILVDGKKV
ncbi:MAG: DUF427 domain-containing protein [Alphaproteobacteria bacterium]